MADKNTPQKNITNQPNTPKGTVVQPHPGSGHVKPKLKANKDANPAGQGNEGDNVMLAGREPGG